MSQHEFTLVLDRTPTEDELDALFEAGLDDSTPEFGPRAVPVLHVHRDGDSLAAAVVGAVAQAEAAGFGVVGVRTEDLVTVKTIAARTSRGHRAAGRAGELKMELGAGEQGFVEDLESFVRSLHVRGENN
ncbi:hypothetical protein [Nocardia sp. SSK8]|uniref:hypothetical protein n=1 Tax=Nocardia sp. SSK8 TaxID=3120154 RepID=UPI00300A36AD